MGYSSQNAQKSNQIGKSLKPSTSRSKGQKPKEEEGREKNPKMPEAKAQNASERQNAGKWSKGESFSRVSQKIASDD